MNWFKFANLYDELSRFGPDGPDWIDPNAKRYEGDAGDDIDRYMKEHYRRRQYINNYGWSVPNIEAIEQIKAFVQNDKVIEVGGGLGLWAKLMRDEGINVTVTDNLSSHQEELSRDPFIDVKDMSNEAAMSAYGTHGVLMLVWPPYDDPMANNTLKKFLGNKLIFVGEGGYGCTGDDSFFCTLAENWEETDDIDIPQWSGIHDYLTFYVRK